MKAIRHKRRIWVGSIMLATAMLVSFSFSLPADRYFEIAKNLEIFATLFKQVNALYVDEVSPNNLVRTGIDEMLESLDPYTNYIPEDEVESFRTENTGQYGGIGIVTRQIGTRTVVAMVMEGYAGERGGMKIGDEIVKINDIDIARISNEEAGQLMKGQVGKPLSLTVTRIGHDQPITLQFVREHIKVSSVPYFGMLNKNVGYVQLSDFTQDAGHEVRNALAALKQEGATRVILDLRDNPGGLLIEAVNVCNVFVPKGKMVVTTRGRVPDNNASYETLSAPEDTEIPLTVLIDRGSASASEIVAGTMQDYDRGVILGERSYGKGLVQISRPLSYNAQLKVTTAKYYTPSGRCIQVMDYSHRRPDGSVARVPDSLKRSFRTTNNRVVFDGGGIEPDVAVDLEQLHPLTEALLASGVIFDYATSYAYGLSSPPDPASFSLTDAEYAQFAVWAGKTDYHYQPGLQSILNEFETDARMERRYDEIKPQIDQLQKLIDSSRKNDIVNLEDQIRRLLEEEIIERFHLQKGGIRLRLSHDPAITEAIAVLNDPAHYKKILEK